MGTMIQMHETFPGLEQFERLRSRGVGFDRLFESMNRALLDTRGAANYPPYDIVQTGENAFEVSMAVAGFSPDEVGVEYANGTLTIRGEKSAHEESDVTYLHRGIANRRFEQTFSLAEHVRVGEAVLDNGLLKVSLVRELPEALKARSIEVKVR